jgi:hypothetical protein
LSVDELSVLIVEIVGSTHPILKIRRMLRCALFSSFLFVAMQLHAQHITQLTIGYKVAHDCEQKADNEEGYVSGGCGREQTLEYHLRGRKLRTRLLRETRLFWEWKGGFQPNSIKDSVHVKRLFFRNKLPAEELETLLSSIVQLQSDSVMVFRVEDFSANEALIVACADSSEYIKQWTNADLDVWLVSSVITRFSIDFSYNGVEYTLVRSEGNPWSLYYTTGETEKHLRFLHTGLDALLTHHLPKSFKGIRISNNRHWEEQLKQSLDLE